MNNTSSNKNIRIVILDIIMKNPQIIIILIAAFFMYGLIFGILIERKTNNKNIIQKEIYISQEELINMLQNKNNSINYKLIIKEK